MTKRKQRSSLEYHRDLGKERKKAKAKKVRINLDDYHRRMGGIYDKKVIFYCMPKKSGKTKKAMKKFEEHGGPEDGLFITITDGNEKQTHGIVFDKDQDIVIDPIHSFIIIDDIHLLSVKKIITILNQFRSSVLTSKLLCFGTNADENGKPIAGARHLEEVCDKVFYETDPCYSCGKYGKTCFTKTLFEKHRIHESDCRIPDYVVEEGSYFDYECDYHDRCLDDDDGYYYERDFCFDCRDYAED